MNAIQAYADTLVASVDGLLAKGSDLAFAATLRIDVNNYNDENDEPPAIGGFLHLACHAPNDYVGVYAAFTQRPESLSDQLQWTCVGCHDSCWRQSVERCLVDAYRDVVAAAERSFEWPIAKLSVYLHMDNVVLAPAQMVLGRYVVNRKVEAFSVAELLAAA